MTVKDNGIGLADQNHDGNGIRGMKERIALIDGFVELGTINPGTLLTVKFQLLFEQEKMR